MTVIAAWSALEFKTHWKCDCAGNIHACNNFYILFSFLKANYCLHISAYQAVLFRNAEMHTSPKYTSSSKHVFYLINRGWKPNGSTWNSKTERLNNRDKWWRGGRQTRRGKKKKKERIIILVYTEKLHKLIRKKNIYSFIFLNLYSLWIDIAD